MKFFGFPERTAALVLGGAALGAIVFATVQTLWMPPTFCENKFNLLNPYLPCETSAQKSEWDYEPLRDILTRKKAEWKDAGKVSHLSIYFRDLSPGPRFGIGEYDQFSPASLTKLPILIAYLHEADINPELLDKTLTYTGTLDTNVNVEADQTIQPNTPYTIRELLRKMIVYSDNYSYVLLTQELNKSAQLSAYYTFRDLDILEMMLAPRADVISIQAYGNLFAILYNTGYLSKESSQFALELLSEVTFTDGIVSGVPEGTRVAHKFGNRDLEGSEIQLHDCGIVYHPSMPYVLCVMTSGTDMEAEKEVIADVSQTVYSAITNMAEKKI